MDKRRKCGPDCSHYQEIKANFSRKSFGFYCMHPALVTAFVGTKVKAGDLCLNRGVEQQDDLRRKIRNVYVEV